MRRFIAVILTFLLAAAICVPGTALAAKSSSRQSSSQSSSKAKASSQSAWEEYVRSNLMSGDERSDSAPSHTAESATYEQLNQAAKDGRNMGLGVALMIIIMALGAGGAAVIIIIKKNSDSAQNDSATDDNKQPGDKDDSL